MDVRLNYIYRYCNDISEIRHFYTDVLGCKEKSFGEYEGFLWLEYNFQGICLMFHQDEKKALIIEGFAKHPSHDLGSLEITWFSIKINESKYLDVINTIESKNFKCLTKDLTSYKTPTGE